MNTGKEWCTHSLYCLEVHVIILNMVVVLIGWSPDNAADQNPKHTLWRSEHFYPLLRISLLSLETACVPWPKSGNVALL